MAVYLIESNNIYNRDVEFLTSNFPIYGHVDLSDLSDSVLKRIVNAVRRVLFIEDNNSIEETLRMENDSNVGKYARDILLKEFDKLSQIGTITEDLRGLSMLLYGEDWVSSI